MISIPSVSFKRPTLTFPAFTTSDGTTITETYDDLIRKENYTFRSRLNRANTSYLEFSSQGTYQNIGYNSFSGYSNTGAVTGTSSIQTRVTQTPVSITFRSNSVDQLQISNPQVKVLTNLYVAGSGEVATNFRTIGNTSTGGSLTVTGNTGLSGLLTVRGNSILSGNLINANNTTLSGFLLVGGNTTLSGALLLNNSATLSSTLRVRGATTLSNNLVTVGSTTLSGSLLIGGGTSLSGSLLIGGLTSLSGSLAVRGNTGMSGTLSVSGAASLTNSCFARQLQVGTGGSWITSIQRDNFGAIKINGKKYYSAEVIDDIVTYLKTRPTTYYTPPAVYDNQKAF